MNTKPQIINLHVLISVKPLKYYGNMDDTASQITGSWLFVQQLTQANIKSTLKLRTVGPLWGESTGSQWNLLTKGQ